MNILKYSVLIAVLSILMLSGCKEIYDQPKYTRPPWLKGKLYTQINSQEELSEFSHALEITGYDTILDLSGSFTVFAPSNGAFNQFFSENPQYGSNVEDIPLGDLTRIVRFHIIQDAWSKAQLQMLDIDGWIDPDDPDNKPRAYKRQTLLKDPNQNFWVKTDKGTSVIVDSTEANESKKVFTRSRKYVPIFFKGLFDIFNLNSDDYEFYFNRTFDEGSIYYAGAKLDDEELFAENGFAYIVDRVVLPMLNARQILDRDLPGESYRTFLDLSNLFSTFEFNSEATYSQYAAKVGLRYDTLYDLSYPDMPFDIHQELTGPSTTVSEYTYAYHNALFIPTDIGFQKFLDEIVTDRSGFPHWPDFEGMPLEIKQIIMNTHLALKPVYHSDIILGFENADKNTIRIDESSIIRKEYGSNCTFLGLNEAVVPRAFSSVSAPVYLRPTYKTLMYAIEYSRVLSAITEEDAEYCFFALSDVNLSADSSLMLNWENKELNQYTFRAFDRSESKMIRFERRDLAKLILNQIGTSLPDGFAKKEFIENLAGNYIVWNNVNGTVSGSSQNVFGYRGDSVVSVTPNQFDEPVDNGIAYNINAWLTPTKKSMFVALSAYQKFNDLLLKAGLYDPKLYKYTFLADGELYTIFAPSDEALTEYGADTLAGDELEKFLKYHFVKRHLVFTDGKKDSQSYETLRIDESSTQYTSKYSHVSLRTNPDLIEVLDAVGTPYISIPENSDKTNIMVGRDTDPTTSSDMDYSTIAVIHEIDKVLVKQ